MKKHLSYEQLALYSEMLAKNMLHKIPNKIKEHIHNCDICANEATELSFIIEDVEKSISIQNIKSTKRRHISKYKYLAIAASILLPLVLWFSINYFSENKKEHFADKNDTENIKDSIKQNENKIIFGYQNKDDSIEKKQIPKHKNNTNKKLLASYIPHADTEKLYNNFKANMRSNEIEIITKKDIIISKKEDFVLEWENPEHINLTIEFFNNKGTNIISESMSGSIFQSNKKLKKGLYYWKLYNEEFDLLWCGKIIIN